MYLNEQIQQKWAPVLEHADLPAISDVHKRAVTATILENTEQALRQAGAAGGQYLLEASPANSMGASSSAAGDGAVDVFDPVLISLVRRAMPNLIAYDICGVQPMTGPSGLIFAMRARYANQAGGETFYNEVNTAFSTSVSGANTFGLPLPMSPPLRRQAVKSSCISWFSMNISVSSILSCICSSRFSATLFCSGCLMSYSGCSSCWAGMTSSS